MLQHSQLLRFQCSSVNRLIRFVLWLNGVLCNGKVQESPPIGGAMRNATTHIKATVVSER